MSRRRTPEQLRAAVDLVAEHGGNVLRAARAAGMSRDTLQAAYNAAKTFGIASPRTAEELERAVLGQLIGGRARRVDQMAADLAVPVRRVEQALAKARAKGVNLFEFSGVWSIEKRQPAGGVDVAPYVSEKDGSYRFGFVSDNHLCSKYAREDVLKDVYRKFAALGISRVYNTGNWIDGEARFNKFDLKVHGMQGQLDYCVQEYPHVPGITTYAIAGDDHEGWYSQREGVDIGRMLERNMVDAGRRDWQHLGYMEAYVPLKHKRSGKTAQLHLMHPGGGSAYATSYTIQKIVEGYGSGDKPAVLLAGHYHKLEFLHVRGVACVQTGCTQDQTPFARKKRLRFEIGAGIIELHQNPETGAIERAGVEIFNYFDKGYYENQRWSHSGPVVLPRRV